jgi:predicted O-methyltransferase YrrM
MVDKCFQQTVGANFKLDLLLVTERLKNNSRSIQVKDAGAGSKYFDQERRIKDIYQISSTRGKYGILLYRLSNYYRPKRILEFGTSLGVGTICLAQGNPESTVVTVEACPETLSVAKENFTLLKSKNIETVNATFDEFLNSYTGEGFDLVFIDGHHDGRALLNYLDRLDRITHDSTLFVLDDIRWSASMKAAFDQLVESEQYHVTLDLFRTGIILKRPQQVKEHFVLSC